MSIRRLGKSNFIRLGDKWLGINCIRWVKFDEKTMFSSRSVTVDLIGDFKYFTFQDGSDEYKFLKGHFE